MDALPRGKPSDPAQATRNHSGLVLNALKDKLPELIGGSADLTPSNMTFLKGVGDYQKATPAGRYIRFGVREHAMAAICNGITAYGGLIPFCGTFLNFIGYAAGAVRLSALSQFRVLYVGTHDSIGLGEDGPTHQPVEMLLSLRATPNMYVYRPCDATETSAAYASAILNPTAPSVFALARAGNPNFEGSSFEGALKGGYHIFRTSEGNHPRTCVIASTGTEVSIAVEAAKKLGGEPGLNVFVASMVCLEVLRRPMLMAAVLGCPMVVSAVVRRPMVLSAVLRRPEVATETFMR